jgi:hypothetical protein
MTGIRERVRLRDGLRCIRCAMTNAEHLAKHGRQLHVHRAVAGGPYTLQNCVTLCYACHGREPKVRQQDQRRLWAEAGFVGVENRIKFPKDLAEAIYWARQLYGFRLDTQYVNHRLRPIIEADYRKFCRRSGWQPPPKKKNKKVEKCH